MRESTSNARPDSNPGTSGRDSSALSSEVDGLRAQVARQAARIRQHEQDHKALQAKYTKLKDKADTFYGKVVDK